MPALLSGGHLMHALVQQNGIAMNFDGSVACLERVESQPARCDRGDERCLGRSHATIVGTYEVVCVKLSEHRCIRANECHSERIVYGANAPADGIGAAGRERVMLRAAGARGGSQENKHSELSEAAHAAGTE